MKKKVYKTYSSNSNKIKIKAKMFSYETFKENLSYPRKNIVVVVLLDPIQEMGAQRNSAETQQSGYTLKSGSEVKMEK